jgi:serine/threonine-protein kinase
MDGEAPLVKLFDIGSKTVSHASTSEIQYLAPERYSNDSAGDARSDVYSLGVVLYEMLAGTVPLRADRLPGL